MLNRYRIWRKFGWKLEDFFRRFLGLKLIDEGTRFLWLFRKEVELTVPQFIAARERFAEKIFADMHMPSLLPDADCDAGSITIEEASRKFTHLYLPDECV